MCPVMVFQHPGTARGLESNDYAKASSGGEDLILKSPCVRVVASVGEKPLQSSPSGQPPMAGQGQNLIKIGPVSCIVEIPGQTVTKIGAEIPRQLQVVTDYPRDLIPLLHEWIRNADRSDDPKAKRM